MATSTLAAYPAYRLGGRESLQSMLFGAGVSLVTIVLSYLALSFAFRGVKQPQMFVVLGGLVLRLGLLYGLLALAARTLVVEMSQLVIWLVSFYVVLVVAEAWELAAETRGRRSGGT